MAGPGDSPAQSILQTVAHAAAGSDPLFLLEERAVHSAAHFGRLAAGAPQFERGWGAP